MQYNNTLVIINKKIRLSAFFLKTLTYNLIKQENKKVSKHTHTHVQFQCYINYCHGARLVRTNAVTRLI